MKRACNVCIYFGSKLGVIPGRLLASETTSSEVNLHKSPRARFSTSKGGQLPCRLCYWSITYEDDVDALLV